MTTVLFLGAGASVDAGYPPTASLLNDMAKCFENSVVVNDRTEWEKFDSFRRNADGVVGQILNSSNPELVLTLPDLVEETRQYADNQASLIMKQARHSGNEKGLSKFARWFSGKARTELSDITLIKPSFQRVAQSFFLRRHCDDTGEAERERRDYLHTALSNLDSGDVVITTNWDTLAERVLLELDKWTPSDGYGFPVTITLKPNVNSHESLATLNQPSKVKVLKLHGSAGWFRTEEGGASDDFYLCYARYLQYLGPEWCEHEIHDAKEPPPGHGPNLNPVILFPSYLKQLNDPVLRSIWEQAAEALNQAKEVTFVGYSLPSADVAVRVLINPLRQKLADKKTEAIVVNPDKNVLASWKDFLGDSVKCVPEKARKHYQPNG